MIVGIADTLELWTGEWIVVSKEGCGRGSTVSIENEEITHFNLTPNTSIVLHIVIATGWSRTYTKIALSASK